MTKIMFLYNNLVDKAILTASSAAVGYPVSNLKNQLRNKCYKTAGSPAGMANVVFDFGAARSVNCIALTGYDWALSPGTLIVEFNDTNTWGAPAETKVLEWKANPTVNGNKATIILIFESINYQFARLNVVYSPGGTPTDWQLGRIFIGQYFQPEAQYNYGYQVNMIDPSLGSRSVGGQPYYDEIEKYREISFPVIARSQDQWKFYQRMFNFVGVSRDLFVAFDYDNEPDEMTIYGKFSSLPDMQDNRQFDISVTFEESR